MKNRIRECRLALGMSQAELGNQVGFADNTISNYENNLRELGLAMWECLASALHVSPAYLVGWSDEKG
jgi:transcriptional regulator with XRE-family HTH domain|nr:MAG TPA: helix-turn-helix domain protein [Caudoviricetes sp.]